MNKRIAILSAVSFACLLCFSQSKAQSKEAEVVIELDEVDAGSSITEYDVSSCAAACQRHWSEEYRRCNSQSACERFVIHMGNNCVRRCNGEDAGPN